MQVAALLLEQLVQALVSHDSAGQAND
jgi:hypothetical protein